MELSQTVYALDSTTIGLSLFPWARFRFTKAALQLHTPLDWRGPIPTRITLSDGKQADVGVLDEWLPQPGAFSVMDRGYVDFRRRFRFVLAGAFFVTRTKADVQLNRLASLPVDKRTGVRSDHIVWLRTVPSATHYPERLGRVSYRDPESGKTLAFLTHNFDLPARTIAQLMPPPDVCALDFPQRLGAGLPQGGPAFLLLRGGLQHWQLGLSGQGPRPDRKAAFRKCFSETLDQYRGSSPVAFLCVPRSSVVELRLQEFSGTRRR